MQELADKYIQDHGVTFILQAVDEDGEVIVQETSNLSFDDVSSYSWQLDQAFYKVVQDNEEARTDLAHAVEEDEAIQDKSY